MNTTEVISKSIVGGAGREEKIIWSDYEISDVLNSCNNFFFNEFSGLAIAEDGEIRSYYRYQQLGATNITFKEDLTNSATPEEVYFLTQVILNTLNIEPGQFHDMFDIPGLEGEAWDQLAGIAQYLIAKGWIEPKAVKEKLLVKLTIEGEIYLHNNALSW